MIRPDPDDVPLARGCPTEDEHRDPCGILPPERRIGRRPRLPGPLRTALLVLLCLFAGLALVDMALSIIDPGRPMHVARLVLEPFLRLSGLMTLGMGM